MKSHCQLFPWSCQAVCSHMPCTSQGSVQPLHSWIQNIVVAVLKSHTCIQCFASRKENIILNDELTNKHMETLCFSLVNSKLKHTQDYQVWSDLQSTAAILTSRPGWEWDRQEERSWQVLEAPSDFHSNHKVSTLCIHIPIEGNTNLLCPLGPATLSVGTACPEPSVGHGCS